MRGPRRIQARVREGDVGAMRVLARSLELSDRADEALAWRERAAMRSADAAKDFADRIDLPVSDDPQEAEQWLQRLDKTKLERPLVVLCDRLIRAGRTDAATHWLSRLAGEPGGVPGQLITALLVKLTVQRREGDAEALLRPLAERGSAEAASALATRLARKSDDEATRWWQEADRLGDKAAFWQLVGYYLARDRAGDLESVLRPMADRGHSRAQELLRRGVETGISNIGNGVDGVAVQAREILGGIALRELGVDYRASPYELGPDIERPRYLLATLPGQVPPSADLSLVVQVSDRDETPWGAVKTSMRASGTITVSVQAEEGLIPTDSLERTLDIPANGPSVPIRFTFRTTRPGTFRVRVLAWAGGTFLAQLETTTVVKSDYEEGIPAVAAMSTTQPRRGQTALLVRRRGDRYEFQLLSDMQPFAPAWSDTLVQEPALAVERTVAMLKQMAEGRTRGYSEKTARRWVKETGIGLWQDIVPAEIREQYWQIHDRITSLTVITDHDALPWELLHPMRRGSGEAFLVERFPVVRSVFGPELALNVGLAPRAYVLSDRAPTDAADEIERITRLIGAGTTLDDVDQLLDLIGSGRCGALHFACHNSFSVDHDGSKISMSGGEFRPRLLNSAVSTQALMPTSPLVFINACRTAGVAPEYSRTTGWAQQFMAAGAGAFVGTLWPVRSDSARTFAESFYYHLTRGKTLGVAAHEARLEATRNDMDPTWLAYTVYGDPAATARLYPPVAGA